MGGHRRLRPGGPDVVQPRPPDRVAGKPDALAPRCTMMTGVAGARMTFVNGYERVPSCGLLVPLQGLAGSRSAFSRGSDVLKCPDRDAGVDVALPHPIARFERIDGRPFWSED